LRYLLDSNAVISMLRGHVGLIGHLRRHDPDDIGISAIVEHELHYGAHKGGRTRANLERLAELRFAVLEFDAEDGRRSGELRAVLAAIGRPIGPYDVLIAGQALARGLTLITHNTREFRTVPGLRVEDWEG
jgi:tRNA(fMet)-specific endonuclease VapC